MWLEYEEDLVSPPATRDPVAETDSNNATPGLLAASSAAGDVMALGATSRMVLSHNRF